MLGHIGKEQCSFFSEKRRSIDEVFKGIADVFGYRGIVSFSKRTL